MCAATFDGGGGGACSPPSTSRGSGTCQGLISDCVMNICLSFDGVHSVSFLDRMRVLVLVSDSSPWLISQLPWIKGVCSNVCMCSTWHGSIFCTHLTIMCVSECMSVCVVTEQLNQAEEQEACCNYKQQARCGTISSQCVASWVEVASNMPSQPVPQLARQYSVHTSQV